eukprot:719545-Prymnesium_polylepis.1
MGKGGQRGGSPRPRRSLRGLIHLFGLLRAYTTPARDVPTAGPRLRSRLRSERHGPTTADDPAWYGLLSLVLAAARRKQALCAADPCAGVCARPPVCRCSRHCLAA